jgi:heterotetrameric sarcosine oxidase gamma subunit
VPDLIAKSPLAGQAPLTAGGVTLAEMDLPRITSVAPLAGAALKRALKGMGLVFPGPNRVSASGAARLVWSGREQAFLMGADPAPLAGLAALSDQNDGWAGLALEGAGAVAVLARLVPLDLRGMAGDACARAPLNHMPSLVLRPAPGRFEILVFRSMARTAWHEVAAAMTAVAAREQVR